MAAPITMLVRKAVSTIWPELRDEKSEHVRTRRVTRDSVEVVAWKFAKHGLMRTEHDQAVIDAVKAWYAVGPERSDEELDAAEDALIEAVRGLPEYHLEASA